MDVYGEQSWWNFSCDLYISLFDGRPKRHRSDLQMSLWMEILSREKLHLLIYFVLFLTTLWMCYRSIKGILGSCELLCLLFSMLSIFEKNSKVKFFIFFSWVFSFVVGSLWGRFEIVLGRLKIVVGRCGSFRVLVTTFLYILQIHLQHSLSNTLAFLPAYFLSILLIYLQLSLSGNDTGLLAFSF